MASEQDLRPNTIQGGVAPVDERARVTYRYLRETGLSDADIMAFAGELLSLVATDVRNQSAAE